MPKKKKITVDIQMDDDIWTIPPEPDDIWTTANGRQIKFCDIEDEHLKNIFNHFIEDRGMSIADIKRLVSLKLIDELKKRKLGSIEDVLAEKGIEKRIERKGW